MNTPSAPSVQDAGVNTAQETGETIVQTAGEQPDETARQNEQQASAEQTPVREVHQQNWNNGQRRIKQRQSLKARIAELEQQLAQYRSKNDDESRFRAEMVQDRLTDMQAMSADAEAEAFANRAEAWFGDETEQFMNDTYRYAPYVNAHEPDLLRYANREYGLILLHEWYKRMDNPQLRQEWLGFTAFEKGRVLDNFYKQIADIVAQSQKRNGQPANTSPAPMNVPVPNGGRQSAASGPTDDFGIALGEALNKYKR